VRRLGPDPFLQDIKRSAKAGYFDDYEPSELALTPTDELLERVSLMSAARRRSYLASISNMPETDSRLSPKREVKGGKKGRWLSRDV
jgi:hypothetical protein